MALIRSDCCSKARLMEIVAVILCFAVLLSAALFGHCHANDFNSDRCPSVVEIVRPSSGSVMVSTDCPSVVELGNDFNGFVRPLSVHRSSDLRTF
jgi:hypothetical protein